MRRLAAALLVATGLAIPGAALAAQPSDRARAVTVEDTTGDVRLTDGTSSAPAEARYAQVDLTRVELVRRRSSLRVVFSLAGPPGVEGYSSLLTLAARTAPGAQQEGSLRVTALVNAYGADAVAVASNGTGADPFENACDTAVSVEGARVVIGIPGRCLPRAFRGPVVATTELFVSPAHGGAIARDRVRFDGRPGIPAAP